MKLSEGRSPVSELRTADKDQILAARAIAALKRLDKDVLVYRSLGDFEENGKLALRRGFKIDNGERFVVAEDVITRGGRVQETVDIVRAHGGVATAVGLIVDRSGKPKPNFGCPFVSLVEMEVENFEPDKLPPDLAKIPAVKPGSK